MNKRLYYSIVAVIIVFSVGAIIRHLVILPSDSGEGGKLTIKVPETASVATIVPRTPPEGASEFRSQKYGFSFFYPDTMSYNIFDEGGGATSFTFENAGAGIGFQIFIVPYTASKITEERLIDDLSGSSYEKMESIFVDGAEGVAFYSRNDSLGETREVWFINEGHLFEITTFKTYEKWLRDILLTWQFY